MPTGFIYHKHMTVAPKSIISAAIAALVILIVLRILGLLTTTTLLTLAALVISFCSLAYQIWRTGLVQAADLLMRFEQNFFGPEKAKQRSLAATNHIKNPEDFHEMEDILDFFETIAMLTRKRALDRYMVWHTFDYWIERYYAIALPYIHSRQQKEPGLWADLNWLIPELKHLQSKTGNGDVALSPDALRAFLAEEASEA